MFVRIYMICFYLAAIGIFDSCTVKSEHQTRVCQVHKLTTAMSIKADWYKPQWQAAKPVNINLFMGQKPDHIPKAQAKLLYDDPWESD